VQLYFVLVLVLGPPVLVLVLDDIVLATRLLTTAASVGEGRLRHVVCDAVIAVSTSETSREISTVASDASIDLVSLRSFSWEFAGSADR